MPNGVPQNETFTGDLGNDVMDEGFPGRTVGPQKIFNKSEILIGLDGDDLIFGFNGADTIYGGSEDDLIFGDAVVLLRRDIDPDVIPLDAITDPRFQALLKRMNFPE